MWLLPILALLPAAAIEHDPPLTQTELNIRATRDFEEAQAELNAQWEITSAKTRESDARTDRQYDQRPGHSETLLEAQRAWLRFREAHCVSEGFYARGGSLEPMLVAACKAELTLRRTEQLRKLAEWPR